MERADDTIWDLSGQKLKRIPRYSGKENPLKVTHIHLDHNDIQKIEFVTEFINAVEFSATHNHLLRMYNITPMKNLVKLDLSFNKIICIEGLKDLTHLVYLNLSHNRIKELNNLLSTSLEYLDVSDNVILSLANLSQLIKLKKLFLHANQIASLRHAEVYLPKSLEVLTLAKNKLSDLNEISHLVGLVNLKELSVLENPCVDMTGQVSGFDYRPFLINWCLELKVIDGYAVDELESLRGEWLYSQGKGRQFRLGEHSKLVQYLTENLPFNNDPLQSEQERKLRLILSKAQQHQSQLMSESLSSDKPTTSLMSRSLDPSLLQRTKEKPARQVMSLSQSLQSTPATVKKQKVRKEEETKAKELKEKQARDGETKKDGGKVDKAKEEEAKENIPQPLPAASKLVPVPESLISPMVANVPDMPIHFEPVASTSTDPRFLVCDEMSPNKLQTIKSKANERRSKRTVSNKESAAICIQKNWRGYRSRMSNPSVLNFYQQLVIRRINQHIVKLSNEIGALQSSLENEHRLHVLQMQAINALWRRMSIWQMTRQESEAVELRELTASCAQLNAQVEDLQQNLNRLMINAQDSSSSNSVTVATQTDIVAVNSPDETSFLHSRPSSLPLSTQQVTQYAENLVGDAFRDTIEEHNSEAEQ